MLSTQYLIIKIFVFKGETGSWGTGPKADHTLGNEQGSYLYVETSYAKQNDTANLQSPLINFAGSAPSTVCVRFWYHMFGQHVGAFNIYQSTKRNVLGKLVWQRKGSLVDQWVYGHVSVQRDPAFYVSLFFRSRKNSLLFLFMSTDFSKDDYEELKFLS